jgi:type IV secretion system protein VirD4
MSTPMTGRKGEILIVLAAAAFGALIVAGQYAGALLFVRIEQLPDSVVGVLTLHDYWQAFGDVHAVKKALAACTLVSILIPLAPLVVVGLALYGRGKRELHGSARFARAYEIRKSGLLTNDAGKPSIIVGRYRGKYLRFGGQQFVMLAAPTRSGKGVAVVLPNLLTYADSVVVLDLKLENYLYTSGYRAKYGHKVFLFAPFDEDGRTHRWNVFDTIAHRPAHLRIGDVQAISQKLYPANVDAKTKFWNDLARNLFVGLVLYLMETGSDERPCTFGEVLRESSGRGKPVMEHIGALAKTPGLSDACTDALNRFLTSSNDVLNSILSTFNAPLLIFANPLVDAATSASDFDVREVRRQRMTIYLGVQPNRLEDAALLVNIFFSQLIDLNTDVLPEHDSTLKYQCLLVMDEFTAIGKVNIIDKANAFIAGYNVRLLTIIQSVSQLEPSLLYGKEGARTLVVNHGLKVVYPPRDNEEAKQISETLGYFTESGISTGRTRGKNMSTSVNTSDQRRALMLPRELQEMPQEETLLLGVGKPIRCNKATYFDDPAFIDRLKEISPSLDKLGRALPTEAQLKDAAKAGELATNDIPTLDLEAWTVRHSARAASVDATGKKIVRARDLLDMKDQDVTAQLQAAAARRIEANIFALTGIRFEFPRNLTSPGVRIVSDEATSAATQEVVNG